MLDAHDNEPTSPAPTPRLLVAAYCQGLFPMARSRRSRGVDWYCPDPRAVVPLETVTFSRSLRQKVGAGVFEVTRDRVFERVMRACAEPRPDHPETWINDDIIRAYTELHEMGLAHSVETWRDNELVGGLYGVSIGGAFFGESMFSRPELGGTDASKVAFVHLVGHLRSRGYVLLDSQINSPHMRSLGAVDMPREQYMQRLAEAIEMRVRFAD